MSSHASATAQVRAQVAAIHRTKRSDETCIAIRVIGGWNGDETAIVEGQTYRFVRCDSPLAVREALVEHESNEGIGLVIVTSLEQADLGSDVLARLVKRKLYRIDPWGTALALFRAREVAPGLRSRRLLAEALLEDAPADGYNPVPSGVLDEETVLGTLLARCLGLEAPRPSVGDLLTWSLGGQSAARFAALGVDLRAELISWIERSAGPAGRLVLDLFTAGQGQEAIPIGLACIVVFDTSRPAEVREAAVRLERYVGNSPLVTGAAVALAGAAAEAVERVSAESGNASATRLLERADALLEDLHVAHFAYLSRLSPLGFDQRLERFGKRLQATLKEKVEAVPRDLADLAEAVYSHRGARRSPERSARVEMAMRLLSWLVGDASDEVGSFEDAARAYARDGGFVDWARHVITGGEGVASLHKAYGRLAELCGERREAGNHRFAELLASWTEAGSVGESVLRVEDILARAVAPAAATEPVLLIVVDGMSFAVFRELIADVSSHGWIELGPEGGGWPVPVVAALPSVTEVSRASLFAGRLARGKSDFEARAFAEYSDLIDVSKSGAPPLVFHKSTLSDAGGLELAPDVRDAIVSKTRRVVAVVVNAVDDHLLKGGQIEVPWTLAHIPVLRHLLHAAHEGGRLVVLTSDHGHVIERGTEYRKSGEGERYRADDGHPLDDEIRVAGSRVVLPDASAMIAPFRENVRYAVKKHGYHGGVTPQECLIPLAVLSRNVQPPKGWEELPFYRPAWWGGPVLELPAARPAAASRRGKSAESASGPALPLFDAREPAAPAGDGDLAARVVASEVFGAQSKLVGPRAPKAADVARFLEVLDEHGGVALKTALAQRLGLPELRMSGFIAGVRRLLNVDGYPVVGYEEGSETVRLNRELLRTQFAIEK